MICEKLVSVIVPVYNVEHYLCKCLDSIINQSYHNLEIILVDDGSQDGSGVICDEYSVRDSRVKVLHKENGGLASARQAGFDICKGEYIQNVDSDDWIDPNMISEMVYIAEDTMADIVICDMTIVYKKRNKVISRRPSSFEHDDFIHYVLCEGGGNLANKLFRKSCFLYPSLVRWEPNINVFEDTVTLCKILQSPRRIAHLAKPYYYYNQTNVNSYMRSTNMYYHRRVAYDILSSIIDPKKYNYEFNYLRSQIAFAALSEGKLSNNELYEYLDSVDFNSLRGLNLGLNLAKHEHFSLAKFYVYSERVLKSIIKTILR